MLHIVITKNIFLSGSSGSRRRRKRETVEYSEEASGMTVEDVSNLC